MHSSAVPRCSGGEDQARTPSATSPTPAGRSWAAGAAAARAGRCGRRPAGGGAGGGRALCPSGARYPRGRRWEPGPGRRGRHGHGDRHRDQPQDPGETEVARSTPSARGRRPGPLVGAGPLPAAEAPGSGRPPVTAAGGGVLRPRDSPGRGGGRTVIFVGSGVGAPLSPNRQLPGADSVPGLRLPPCRARPAPGLPGGRAAWPGVSPRYRQRLSAAPARQSQFGNPGRFLFPC